MALGVTGTPIVRAGSPPDDFGRKKPLAPCWSRARCLADASLVTGPEVGDLLAHCCCGGVWAALGLGLGVGHAFFGGMGVRN